MNGEIRVGEIFDELLCGFIREYCACSRLPLPAMLGDGSCVDLFKLFKAVRSCDGYDSVSKYCLWGLVSQEIGLHSGVTSSVKLFYFKYLLTFERCISNLEGLTSDAIDFFSSICLSNDYDEDEGKGVVVLDKSEFFSRKRKRNPSFDDNDDDDDVVILDKSEVEEKFKFCKRKRDRLSDRLSEIVRCSECDFSKLVEAYKQKKDCAEKESDTDEEDEEVTVGALYQAEVPEWNGKMSESDSKWLGTRDWLPLIAGEDDLCVIGKGRPDSCDCGEPGSVECVRLHIAQERVRLHLELGSGFYTWRFNDMGEEVALSWAEEEENKFKAIVNLFRHSKSSLWNHLCCCFHTRSFRSLVSYYYNVFLLRHRAYQNRITPNDVDSDDDCSNNLLAHDVGIMLLSKFSSRKFLEMFSVQA